MKPFAGMIFTKTELNLSKKKYRFSWNLNSKKTNFQLLWVDNSIRPSEFFSEFLTLAFPSVTGKSFDAEQLILRLRKFIILF